MDCSPQGSSVHRLLQARILELVAISSPGDLPNPGIKPWSPALQEDSLPTEHFGFLTHLLLLLNCKFCSLLPVNSFTRWLNLSIVTSCSPLDTEPVPKPLVSWPLQFLVFFKVYLWMLRHWLGSRIEQYRRYAWRSHNPRWFLDGPVGKPLLKNTIKIQKPVGCLWQSSGLGASLVIQ